MIQLIMIEFVKAIDEDANSNIVYVLRQLSQSPEALSPVIGDPYY